MCLYVYVCVNVFLYVLACLRACVSTWIDGGKTQQLLATEALMILKQGPAKGKKTPSKGKKSGDSSKRGAQVIRG